MYFVDGSNLLIELFRELSIGLRAEKPPSSAIRLSKGIFDYGVGLRSGDFRVRSFWFASFKGNEETRKAYASALRENGYEPRLFPRRGNREKGVDIDLTREMLVNAFSRNFDRGVLVAGDEDYVSLVNEVKRYGPRIEGAFFRHGFANELRLSLDAVGYIETALELPQLQGLIQDLNDDALAQAKDG